MTRLAHPSRRYAVALAVAVGVTAALAGCGTSDPTTQPSSSTLSSAPSPATPTPTPSSSPPASPLTGPVTLTRAGGVAGLQDEWTIAANGAVTGTSAGKSVRCTLTRSAHSALVSAVTTGSDVPAPSGRSDQLTVTLTSGSRTVNLGEATGSDPASTQVSALLADLDEQPEARSLCPGTP